MTASPSFSPLTGGCQCGAVRYEITAEPLTTATCHCRDCQYASGGGPAHALLLAPQALAVRRGQAREHRYLGDSGNTVVRSFCPDCSTPLFGHTEGQDYVIVKAGSLDDPAAFRSRMTLWADSAPPWHHVDTSVPCHGGKAAG
ncbi:GFA family protein [Bordetella petrii]|uniref:GFA family protein n=1 Tax=Bordetella petrii TaxID=94624 RepID=A0ABT7W303_9BORD|nr:GFA family protein [Bordetella petrii]MDM9559561.1 GFA family protein [Bordetella petrii]